MAQLLAKTRNAARDETPTFFVLFIFTESAVAQELVLPSLYNAVR